MRVLVEGAQGAFKSLFLPVLLDGEAVCTGCFSCHGRVCDMHNLHGLWSLLNLQNTA
jgi:hypothetical protein